LNLVLFEPSEVGAILPRADPRAAHVLGVLRRGVGDAFDAGVVDGPRGKATLTSVDAEGLAFTFQATQEPAPADPIHLLVALPRPQTARKILAEATTLGVASMRFFVSGKGEAGYAGSALWTSGEWRRHLLSGAAQAFDTLLPSVARDADLGAAVAALPQGCRRAALDNYEATAPFGGNGISRPLALAFGPERGWSAPERDQLRAAGFTLTHLGTRVLRLETAVVAALAVAKAGAAP
jgi:RsmE family RNA methyltransferase